MSWVEGHWQNGKWVDGYYRRPIYGGWWTALAVMSHPTAQKGAWAVAGACLAILAAMAVGLVVVIGAVLFVGRVMPHSPRPAAAASVAVWPPGLAPHEVAPVVPQRPHRSAPATAGPGEATVPDGRVHRRRHRHRSL